MSLPKVTESHVFKHCSLTCKRRRIEECQWNKQQRWTIENNVIWIVNKSWKSKKQTFIVVSTSSNDRHTFRSSLFVKYSANEEIISTNKVNSFETGLKEGKKFRWIHTHWNNFLNWYKCLLCIFVYNKHNKWIYVKLVKTK